MSITEARVSPVDEHQAEVEAAIARIREVHAKGGVPAVRTYLAELQERWPDAERVAHYARLYAPPKVIPTPPRHKTPARSHDLEMAWIRLHASEYPGCWLALYEDRLLAADPELATVTRIAREQVGDRDAVLWYQPHPVEQP